MRQSRRSFLDVLSGGRPDSAFDAGLWIAARGHEDYQAQTAQATQRAPQPTLPPGVKAIRISSNENPLGPGKAALDAIVRKFPEAGRYPFNSTPADRDLVAAIATKFGTKPENIVLGAGSQEILKTAVRAFTSPSRGLVTAAPSFENCPQMAARVGHPVTEIKVDAALRLDLNGMAAAAKGAGLVFLNNPNNPTATVHGSKAVADFVQRVRASSPDTVILIDEAYHDYVTDPSYESAVPLALQTPNVFVTRTFSKAYGMAGLRIGYAIGQTATMKPLAQLKMPYNVSVFGVAAALAALPDTRHIAEERARNTEVRTYTVKALDDLGLQVQRFADQLPVRRSRAHRRGVPRRLREAGDPGGPAVSAARKDARAHLARHDGRDEEGHGSVQKRASACDDDRGQRLEPRTARCS